MSKLHFRNTKDTRHFFTDEYDINSTKSMTYNSIGIRNTRFILNNQFSMSVTAAATKKFDPKSFRGKINFGSVKSGFPLELDINSPSLTDAELTEPTFISSLLNVSGFNVFEAFRSRDQYRFVIQEIMDSYFKMSSENESDLNPNVDKLLFGKHSVSGSALLSPFNVSNELQQAYFYFPLNTGDAQLISGDRVNSATINLKILAHYGDRANNFEVFQGASPLFGKLEIQPRVFEVVRVKKPFGYPLIQRGVNTPEGRYGNGTNEFWESYYGTGSKDVDTSVRSEFTVSKPLKPGDILKIDISDLVQDAIDNRDSIIRFVIRPKMAVYQKNGCATTTTGNTSVANGGFGVGNHYFDFERGGDNVLKQPSLSLNIVPSPTSSGSRRARLARQYTVQLSS